MKRHFFFWVLIKATILTTIPALLLIRMDDANSILFIIIYLQLLLIWAQAEISLRQHLFSRAKFDPTFDIKFEESNGTYRVIIYNLSDNPAYNLIFSPLMTWKHKLITEIDYSTPETPTTCLPPRGKMPIVTLFRKEDKEKIFLIESLLNITFENRYGEYRHFNVYFCQNPLSEDIIGVEYSRMDTPGFLLGFFEEFRLTFIFLKSHTKLSILALLALGIFFSIIWHIYFNIYLKWPLSMKWVTPPIAIALFLVLLEVFLFWLMDCERDKIERIFSGST